MYGWFFRHLPGPTWFRVFLCLVIAAFAVAVLFAYVYPWAERFFGLGGGGPALRPPHSVFSSDCQPFGQGPQADFVSLLGGPREP